MENSRISGIATRINKLSFFSYTLFILLMFTVVTMDSWAISDWEWSKDKGWAQSSGRALPTPSEQLKYAYELEQEGRYLNASKQYFLLLKSFPDSDEAGIGLQRLANCLFMMENYYDAYKALEEVIKNYPFSAKKSDLIKIEFLIGRKFQAGAKVNLLDDNENPAVGKRAAIEIFESVVDNDSVGPYAGASLLGIASCYKDLGEPARGIVYADRVLNEFSMSSDLVAKARIIKKTLEVMQGDADINSVKTAINEAKKAAATDEHQGADDFAAVDDYDEEIQDLEEMQAKKLWDSAEFYRKRGTRDSKVAYKFSLEQIVVRFPNTSYASKARRIVGEVKIPPKKNSWGKFNIPFVTKKEPTFVTAANSDDYVHSDEVPVPGVDDISPDEDIIAAALPSGDPDLPLDSAPRTGAMQKEETDVFTERVVEEDIGGEAVEDVPPIPSANSGSQVQRDVEVEEKVIVIEPEPPVNAQPVQRPRGIVAPAGAGAAAVPLGALKGNDVRSASSSRYPSRSDSALDSVARKSPSVSYNNAPEKVKNQTSASAIPVSSRKKTALNLEAASKARVRANEQAADQNDWDFSEDF